MGSYAILFITPGPAMSVDDGLYGELSKHFSGAIITSSRQEALIQRKKLGSFDYYCRKLPMRRRSRQMVRFSLHTILRCIGWRLGGKRFDLVVTYDPLKTGMLGAVCAPILRSKLVTEVNGVYTSPAQEMDGSGRLSKKLKRWLLPRVEGFVLSRADGVKLLFPKQVAQFEKQLRGKAVAAFPCRVNIRAFLECAQEPGTKEILFAGFPFYLKGVDVLVEAFKLISDEYPDWHLKILGWYPDDTPLMNAIGKHPRIFHQPPVYHRDMPAQIQGCSIFVLPSRSEAMGRVLVEAMAAGKACIGADVDGIPSVIDDGVNGLLFTRENPIDLSRKMRLLIAEPELRNTLGKAARATASAKFTDEVYFRNTEAFYDSVLAR